MDSRFAISRGEADGFEIGSVLTIVLLSDRHQGGDGLRGLEVTESDSHFTADSRRLILGQRLAEGEDIAVGRA